MCGVGVEDAFPGGELGGRMELFGMDHMQVICTLLQTDNHASTSSLILSFLQAVCPSCHPTNGVEALKALMYCIVSVYQTVVNVTGSVAGVAVECAYDISSKVK